jgi:hypothetical protein
MKNVVIVVLLLVLAVQAGEKTELVSKFLTGGPARNLVEIHGSSTKGVNCSSPQGHGTRA